MSLLLLLAGGDSAGGGGDPDAWSISCVAAFGDGPFDVPTYADDLSDRLQRVTWNLGRTRDLTDWLPSGFSLEFDNSDRELDPEYTSGSYYGDLLPRVPVRVQVTHDSTTYDLLHGFAGEDGWEQTYSPPEVSECRVRCVDLLGVQAGIQLESEYQETILAESSLVHYWPLDDGSGASRATEIVNGADGTYRNDPTVIDAPDGLVVGYPSREFDGVNQAVDVDDNAARLGFSTVADDGAAIELWFRTSTPPASGHSVLFAQYGDTGPRFDVRMNTSGQLVVRALPAKSSDTTYTTTESFADGEAHHLMVRWWHSGTGSTSLQNAVDVDGSTVATTGSAPLVSFSGTWGLAFGGNSKKIATDSFAGEIAHVALYEYSAALGSGNPPSASDHYEAGVQPWDGDGTGERIANVLDLVGVPSGLVDVDTGLTTLGPADLYRRTALDYIMQAARTEQGILTIAHWDAGQVYFVDRAAVLTDTRHTTSQATFTDKDATLSAGEYRYEPNLVVEPASINTVINQVTVNYIGGSVTVEDATSIAAYGPRGQSFDTLHDVPSEARSFGEYVLGRYKDPITRVRELTLDCAACPDGLDAALTLRVGDRVTVERKPQNLGNTISDEYLIEGINGEIANGVNTFRVTYYLSPADTKVYGLWGTGNWGTALWAY